MEIREIREKLDQAEKILVGLGGEWQMQPPAGGSLRQCRLADPPLQLTAQLLRRLRQLTAHPGFQQ